MAIKVSGAILGSVWFITLVLSPTTEGGPLLQSIFLGLFSLVILYYLLFLRSPWRLTFHDGNVTASYLVGGSHTWSLREVVSADDRIGRVLGWQTIESRNGAFAFRVYRVLPGYADVLALLRSPAS